MPTKEDIRRTLVRLLNEIGQIPAEKVIASATIDEDLRLSSLAFVELQVAIEDEYDIQIDPVQVVELNEFGPIVDYVFACATGQGQ